MDEMPASPLTPIAKQWLLSLASPFSIIDVDDVVVPARPIAIQAYPFQGSDDALRVVLVDEVKKTLAARRPWETIQLIKLLTSAVRAGRMPPDEAWPILHHVGRLMQTTFSSWSAYGDALIMDFDGVTDFRDDCRKPVAALLKADGAWTRLPWDLDLGIG